MLKLDLFLDLLGRNATKNSVRRSHNNLGTCSKPFSGQRGHAGQHQCHRQAPCDVEGLRSVGGRQQHGTVCQVAVGPLE